MEEDQLDGGTDLQIAEAAPSSVTPIAPSAGINPAAILQALNTGTQGRPMSVLSSERAAGRDRITKILSDQLARSVGNTSEFADVGSALARSIATGGREPYGYNIAQLEGGRLNKAVNVANALSALDKLSLREAGRGGLGNLSMSDMIRVGNFAQRQTEAEARRGNAQATLLQRSVVTAAKEFSDPASAQAFLYAYMADKDQKGEIKSAADLPRAISEGITAFKSKGGRSAYVPTGGGGGGGAAAAPPVPMSGGEVDYSKPMAGKSEFAQIWNSSPVETRKKLYEARVARMTGGGAGGGGMTVTQRDAAGNEYTVTLPGMRGGPDARNMEALTKGDIAHSEWTGLTTRLKELTDESGSSAIGTVGDVARVVDGLLKQAGEVSRALTGAEFKEAGRLASPGALEGISKRLGISGTAETSSRIQAVLLSMAGAYAKAMDEGGRVTKDDLDKALRIFRERSGSVTQLQGAVDELNRDVERKRAAIRNARGASPAPRGEGGGGGASKPPAEMSDDELLRSLGIRQ